MTNRREYAVMNVVLVIVLFALASAVRADDFKKGTFSVNAGGVKWSINYAEANKVTVSRNGEVIVEGSYKVKGDELEVTDEKGPMSCGIDQPGKYKWKLDGKKL